MRLVRAIVLTLLFSTAALAQPARYKMEALALLNQCETVLASAEKEEIRIMEPKFHRMSALGQAFVLKYETQKPLPDSYSLVILAYTEASTVATSQSLARAANDKAKLASLHAQVRSCRSDLAAARASVSRGK